MGRKSTFSHINLSPLKRYNLNVPNFGGVDFTSKQFDVSTGRAIDLLNFMYKDRVIQKRNGYEHVLTIKPTNDYLVKDFDTGETVSQEIHTNNTHFNGMWRFTGEDDREHIIAHIGKLLYEYDKNTKQFTPLTTEEAIYPGSDGRNHYRYYEYEDYRSFAFVGKKRLWFLGGNHYMVIRYYNGALTIKPVDQDENTFIPTTTISITYTDAKDSGNRASLDYANMLTMWRQNLLLSGIGKRESEGITLTRNYEYELDGPLYTPKSDDDMVNLVGDKPITPETKKLLADVRVIIKHRGVI